MQPYPKNILEIAFTDMKSKEVPVVTLIGSSKFKWLFHLVGEKLEKRGVLVLMMSFFQHIDEINVTTKDREILEKVDRKRLKLCEKVGVINGSIPYCNECREFRLIQSGCKGEHVFQGKFMPYIGESTTKEISEALTLSKPIHYMLNPHVIVSSDVLGELGLEKTVGEFVDRLVG